MSQVGHANSKMTMDVYAQLEQRVKRNHGSSFDRLVRQARELRGEDSTAREAAQLAPKTHQPQNRGVFGPTRTRPLLPQNRPEQGKQEWRDPESNRGHHDFQKALRIRG